GPTARGRQVLPGVRTRRVAGAIEGDLDELLRRRRRRDRPDARLAVEARGGLREGRPQISAVLRLVVLAETNPPPTGIERATRLVVVRARTEARVRTGQRHFLKHDRRLCAAIEAGAGLVSEADDHGVNALRREVLHRFHGPVLVQAVVADAGRGRAA